MRPGRTGGRSGTEAQGGAPPLGRPPPAGRPAGRGQARRHKETLGTQSRPQGGDAHVAPAAPTPGRSCRSHTRARTHTHTGSHTHTLAHAHTQTHAHTHTHMHIHALTYTHMLTHTCIHTHTHMHTPTCSHTNSPPYTPCVTALGFTWGAPEPHTIDCMWGTTQMEATVQSRLLPVLF